MTSAGHPGLPLAPAFRVASRPPRLHPLLDALLAFALGVLGFMLPWSVAGVSLTLGVLLLLGGAAVRKMWRTAPWRDPVVAIGLALLAYIVVHTVWVTGLTVAGFEAANRYHELLLAPILLAQFRLTPRKDVFFHAVVAGTVAYALAHWASFFMPGLGEALAPKRISAGFVMALCAFVLLEQARHGRSPALRRSIAAFLALTALFAVEGRTGHLTVVVLSVCAGWLHSTPRWRWCVAASMSLAVLALAMTSGAVQKRMADTLSGSTPNAAGDLTSTGIRLELLRHGLHLARENFLLGAGFAHYAEIHEQKTRSGHVQDSAQRPPARPHWAGASNPHNEYLLQLVCGGLMSFALFVLWVLAPMAGAGRSAQVRGSLFGLSLAFALACLFNSMLADFVEGHFYAAMIAWLLAHDGAAPGR